MEEKTKSEKLKEKVEKYNKLLKEAKRKYAMADFEETKKLLKENNLTWDDVKKLIEGGKKNV